MTITTDPKKFQFELRELYVQVSNLFVLYVVLAKAPFPPSHLSSRVDVSATIVHRGVGIYLWHFACTSCHLNL